MQESITGVFFKKGRRLLLTPTDGMNFISHILCHELLNYHLA